MSLSVDPKGPSGISVEDLLAIASDPERHRLLLSQLAELKEGQAELVRQRAEMEVREASAAALAAEAGRIKADYQVRAARLDAILRSS